MVLLLDASQRYFVASKSRPCVICSKVVSFVAALKRTKTRICSAKQKVECKVQCEVPSTCDQAGVMRPHRSQGSARLGGALVVASDTHGFAVAVAAARSGSGY